MTSHQQDWLEVLGSVSSVRADRPQAAVRPPLSARLCALLFAGRYDREIEAGIIPVEGSPLAVHWTRLTSARERKDLAFALCAVVRDAGAGHRYGNPRVPVHAPAVSQAANVVDEVLERLTGPTPMRARGMARLRLVLADGRGPLYRAGQGTLVAAMRGVLAAL
jgi:hypothetical protein